MMEFHTPPEDIERALAVEQAVPDTEWPLYLKFMSNAPMSQRVRNPRLLNGRGRDVRDGCILTNLFCQFTTLTNKISGAESK
jgi:hypothetical protein